MITGIEGRPGSGKSYYTAMRIKNDLERGRKVFTNIASFSINKVAWQIHKKNGISRERIKSTGV